MKYTKKGPSKIFFKDFQFQRKRDNEKQREA